MNWRKEVNVESILCDVFICSLFIEISKLQGNTKSSEF